MKKNKFKYVIEANGEVKISKAYDLKEIEELGFPDELLESIDECDVMGHDSNNCDCDTPFYSDGEIKTRLEYVGVNDKAGVEIYEGDIGEYGRANGVPFYTKVVYHEQLARYMFEYYEGDDIVYSELCDYDGSTPSDWFTVVGNIHTTPELMEAS